MIFQQLDSPDICPLSGAPDRARLRLGCTMSSTMKQKVSHLNPLRGEPPRSNHESVELCEVCRIIKPKSSNSRYSYSRANSNKYQGFNIRYSTRLLQLCLGYNRRHASAIWAIIRGTSVHSSSKSPEVLTKVFVLIGESRFRVWYEEELASLILIVVQKWVLKLETFPYLQILVLPPVFHMVQISRTCSDLHWKGIMECRDLTTKLFCLIKSTMVTQLRDISLIFWPWQRTLWDLSQDTQTYRQSVPHTWKKISLLSLLRSSS